ncbi:MAG TPA: filamentous hemagglutinin N-terminal domain-containing protein, partial [Ramlibacter sp.]|nr:filamentous hemagglutinin N-terminal domain-containing protein [Ramlibacter sp.]
MGASQDNPRTGYRRVRTVSVRLSRKLRVVYRVGWRAGVSRLLALLLAPACGTAWALPEGMTVAAGQVNASQPNATSLVLNQGTHKAILDWRSFNIQAGESVRFVQLDASSAVLNRVGSGEASRIFGSLSANGQVFLINPAGVLFAPGAQVNVGSLVASTLSLSNADFLAGRYRFENGGATGEVANHGIIRAQPGGYVLLAGPVVTNGGLIQADGGAIGLAAGSRVTLDTSHAGLVRFSVDGAALGALASNSGTLQAEGGAVVLKARSIGDTLATVVNHTGVIRAGTATERNGMVVLSGGESGVVRAAGEISATGTQQGQAGGTIQLFGDKVLVTADARLDASGHSSGGTILVGGDYQGRTADAPNASRTQVAAGAQLAADATVRGDGGKIVVWADGDTRFAGAISARGGVQGGDGGLVEVSGKQQLDFRGRVDVAAPLGTGGKVLLDPQDIVLNTTLQPIPPNNANGTPDVAFADPP